MLAITPNIAMLLQRITKLTIWKICKCEQLKMSSSELQPRVCWKRPPPGVVTSGESIWSRHSLKQLHVGQDVRNVFCWRHMWRKTLSQCYTSNANNIYKIYSYENSQATQCKFLTKVIFIWQHKNKQTNQVKSSRNIDYISVK